MASSNPGSDEEDVLVQEPNAYVRILTLNRPRQLNVISIKMFSQLTELVLAYDNDANVKLVIVKGNGRAFCAGADIVTLARHHFNDNRGYGVKLAQLAYTLCYVIATNTKPQVSILNGIVMGAGAGISIHGRFRVVTENTMFAMPEAIVGGFPDVGASYFLSRLPGFFGEYLGLTAARLDGPEMLALGLATHFVPSTNLALLEEALVSKVGSRTSSTCDAAFISAIIDEYSQRPAPEETSACRKMHVIDKCFSHKTVEEILSALEEESKIYTNGDDWLDSTIQSLKMASPMSLKITLRSIREGRTQGVDECLVRDYRMACHVLEGKISKDAAEGVRALLIEKDGNPKWDPSKLELITDQMVEHYFGKLDDVEELKITARPNIFTCYDEEEVLVQEPNASVRILTLNRPRRLNAISIQMASQLTELFLAYDNDANAKLVIVKGNGRAFSAGGDIVTAARHLRNGNWRYGAKLAQLTYTLCYVIATNTKPQVSILNGIVMGGGAGVSIHGRFRVVTENTMFAMPEAIGGGFPDVGASYFLSRLPGFFGEYLGLTAARLDGPEMLALGLATHFVPSTKLALLEEALVSKVGSRTSSTCDAAFISAIIDEYSQRPAPEETSACRKMHVIDKCFSHKTVEEILSALEEESKININGDDWLDSTIQSLKMASPISLKITLRSIREGQTQGLGECLVRDYRMVCHVLQGKISKDFANGTRALLIERDGNPKWDPSKLELITDQMVEHYFGKLDDVEELKILAKPNKAKL